MSDVLEGLLAERNQLVSGGVRKWKLAKSHHGGRGVFANCDIDSGELVFADFPVINGPKSNNNFIGCTTCACYNKPLRSCSKNCRLPVCSEKCENHKTHRKECELLRSFNIDEEDWSPVFYRSLTLIRCLYMSEDDRRVVRLLHANHGKQVNNQIAVLQKLLGNTLNDSQLEWMRQCCGVLDGTAFEIELDATTNSLKGLYPLSAMMNHNCVPNTRLSYTDGASGFMMLVIASKFIPKGSEVCTSYCPVLWPTNLRRTFLLHTKHFRCECERCLDSTEFGTNLQALRCKCGQQLLPVQALNFNSNWKCNACGEVKSAKFSTLVQQNITLQTNSETYFPDCNYTHVQGRIESVFKATRNGIKSLNISELNEVMTNCLYVLRLIEQLKLGNTQFKGRLCDQLEIIAQELLERKAESNRVEIKKYCESGRIIKDENDYAKSAMIRLRTRITVDESVDEQLSKQDIK